MTLKEKKMYTFLFFLNHHVHLMWFKDIVQVKVEIREKIKIHLNPLDPYQKIQLSKMNGGKLVLENEIEKKVENSPAYY